jgi:undecaprenyl-diphosphatase
MILILGVILSSVAFYEVADGVFQDSLEGDQEVVQFDRQITDFFATYRTHQLTQAMTDITALGSLSVITTSFIILASVLMSYRDFAGLKYLGLVFVGAGLWPLFLKRMFARDRPPEMDHLVHVSDLSFPSGHSFGAAAFYIAFAYMAGRYARSWKQELFFYGLAGLLISLVGISRIYLGVHYPTDVLAGLSGGAAWAMAVSAGYERFKSG